MATVRSIVSKVLLGFAVVVCLHFLSVAALESSEVFHCKDGSKTIASSRVNDDYCDCPDGSDEPKTSACVMLWGQKLVTRGSSSLFKCRDDSAFEQRLPIQWVNDGLCDCCDGSDEPTSGVKCPNTCGEAARDRAAQQQKEEAMRKAALVVKAQMRKKAVENKAALMKQLPLLEKELSDTTKILEGRQKQLSVSEKEEEAERAVLEKQYDEWLSKTDELTKGCVGWRQTKDCDPAAERESARDSNCLDTIINGRSGYCECGEVVDRAGEKAKKSKKRVEPADDEADADGDFDDDDDDKDDYDDGTGDVVPETVEVKNRITYKFVCDHTEFQCAYVCRNGGNLGIDKAALEPKRAFEYEREEAKVLRELVRSDKEKIEDVTKRLEEVRERATAEIDTGELLRTLHGESFRLDFQDYTYELRPFDGAWQRDKGQMNGGPSIGMWGSFAANTYASWAKDKFDYSQMNFVEGLRCYNGIVRSTEVHVVCGATNQLVHVEEPSMCKYRLVFETPAICEE